MNKQDSHDVLTQFLTDKNIDPLASESNKRLLDSVQSAEGEVLLYRQWQQSPSSPQTPQEELEHLKRKESLLAFVHSLEGYRQPRKWKEFIFKIAASVLILMGVTTFQPHTPERKAPIFFSTAAQTKTVRLPDSSRITLFPHSSVSLVAYAGKFDRHLSMTGRVKFEVRKDQGKSFIVTSESLKVSVLGTSFIIDDRSHSENKHVDVQNGRVAVSINAENHSAEYILTRGQQLQYNNQSKRVSQHRRDMSSRLRKKGNVTVDEVNIGDLANILSKEFSIPLQVQENIRQQGAITGEFNHKTLSEILEIVTKLMVLEYTVGDQVIEIKEKGKSSM